MAKITDGKELATYMLDELSTFLKKQLEIDAITPERAQAIYSYLQKVKPLELSENDGLHFWTHLDRTFPEVTPVTDKLYTNPLHQTSEKVVYRLK